ncbi:DNA-directed RNA polymerase, partial [Gregarina niphandrodes]
MSFDANGVICTDINKASFQLLSEEDVKKTAVCRIFSTVIYDGEQAKLGGIHDPRLGPMDSEPRRGDPSCVTCGGRDDCPGHLGYIQLYQPLYHPLFMPTLVRLLKGTCLLCRRLKIDPGLATMYLKKFQMVQMGALQMLEEFEQLSSMSSGGRYEQSSLAERRVEMRRLLADMKVLEEKQRKEGKLLNLEEDISVSSSSIENWRRITRDLYDRCAQSHCTHCGRKFSSVIHKKDLDSNVEIQWNFDADCPVDRNILLKMLDAQEEIERVGDDSIGTVRDARNVANIDDEEIAKDHQTLGRRGRSMGAVNLQAYQIYPIMRDLYNSPDRPLLHFLIPATAKHGARFFFMNVIPVSSNKFRPKAKSLGFGSSADAGAKADEEGGILHPRSAALLEILQENAKIGFALGALRYFDPEAHFAKDEGSLDAAFSMKDKDGVKKAIEDHKGNYSLLHQYCRQTQEKINAYIDSTKTNTRNPPPAIRQWMEKKSGAIRQKMMGKRVNFAARTTIAPDAQINTNEIGIPIPFAMKLSIAEHAVPHNVDLLCKLIMNGSKTYPGCNMIIEPSGRRLDLTRRELTESQKRMQCKLLRNHVQHQMHSAQNSHDLTKPYTVLRHLRDGDVVIMNRQPSLHRASMMAHFVRVLTGQKTFRLHYANCNSYNADFDGDEMNLHCAQDPTARAEAALICNADCNYTVAKSGEPLRGLIQDHVLGGNFLTIRGTFLTRPQYFALVYVGVASFTDKGEKLDLDNGKVVSSEFSAGDPYARALGARNLRIVVEEPTIWKPEPLWTGKQVINSILKTLIDSVAVLEYGRKADGTANQAFLKRYRGINLVSKAKTPGDAWMGRLGTDKEEQIVIIRNSELVQGVFDKAQIGAASYGLVHLCYELFGPRVAGMLLSVFARVFSSYLQIRGFSCSSGDFQMTLEGEKARQRMIARCTAAGTLLQEQFIDSVYQHMHWRENIENASGVQSKYVHVGKALSSALAASKHQAGTLATSYVKERYQQFVKTEQINQFVTVDGLLNKDPQNVRLKNTTVPPHWPADPSKSAESQQNSPWLTEAQRSEFRDQGTAGFGDQLVAEEDLIQSKAGSSKTGLRKATEEHSAVMKAVDCDTSSSWNVSRSLHLIPKQPDWRLGDVKKMYQWMLGQLSKLKAMGASDKDTRQFLLQGFTTVPELAIYFPELAKVVGTRKMWAGERLEDRLVVAAAARLTGTVPPPAPLGRL